MKHLLVLCVLVAYLSSFLVAGQTNGVCKGTIGTSKYDLSGLQAATGGNDQTTKDADGNTYFYRPCQVLQQVECKSNEDPSPAACQKDTRKMAQFHDCGSTNSVTWSSRSAGDNTGFFIQFQGGQDGRKLDVEFICDQGQNPGSLTAAVPTEQPTHFYHLQWRTKFACPGGGDGGDGGGGGDGDDGPAISGGWIFIILLLSLFFIYIVAGIAYNKFRKDAHGLELIPNHEFWFALPRLVWDGNMYTYRKLRGLCGASYESV